MSDADSSRSGLLERAADVGARVTLLLAFGLVLVPATRAPLMGVYYALVAAGILAWLGSPRFRAWLARAFDDVATDAAPSRSLRATVAGFLVVVLALAYLETRSPAYFTQDDNFAQFGPVMMHGGRSFFSGVFPTYNPYQALGMPAASVGTYSLTYPLTYLSYGLAVAVRSPALTLEIFCVLHVVLGYFVSRRVLASIFGARPWIASLSAATYVLSGYDLICGRSWYYMVPLVLFLPLSTHATSLLVRRPDARRAVYLGFVLGIFFHAGNAQMWVYTVSLVAIAVALVLVFGETDRRHRARLVLHGGLAFGTMLAVAAPLLVSQMRLTRDVDHHSWGGGIAKGMLALFVPHPLLTTTHPNEWNDGENTRYAGHLYWSGTLHVLSTLAFAALCARRAVFDKGPRLLFARQSIVFFFLFLVCLSAGLDGSWSWEAMQHLPIFRKFTNPFKMLGFLTWQFAAIGAMVMARVIAAASPASAARATGLVGALMLVFLAWHVQNARTSFHTYAEAASTALPPLLGEAAPRIRRVAALTPWRSKRAGYAETLPHNLATLHQIPSIDGYDPLVGGKPESAHDWSPRSWGEYGVNTVLVSPEQANDERVKEVLRDLPLRKLGETPNVTLYALEGARPLAFGTGTSTVIDHLELRGDGVRLDANVGGDGPDRVTINFLARERMVAHVDGEARAFGKDALGRVVLDVPAGRHEVALVYDGWWTVAGYVVVALLTAAMAWVARTVFDGDRSGEREVSQRGVVSDRTS